MKQSGGSEGQKRRAGESAAERVDDGTVVGLGTGSTAAHAIRELGERVDAGLDVVGVPTSFASRELAREVGVPLADLDAVDGVDVAIDGADQVVGVDADDGGSDAGVVLVKGGGAAHAREKLVDATADAFHVVADPSKLAAAVSVPVPVEVLPAARTVVADAVRERGGDPTLRRADRKDGPVVTDNGNVVLDCAFDAVEAPGALATALSTTPGVVEHGLFVDLADTVHVGTDDGVDVHDVTGGRA
ncbi:ribose-5-phosphate isomerase RpiA [Halorubellus sp. PRR65]|uniref:ribose-5-phosphate isomerase RpiA n=1 Tax=Halorubellus sp. PRR65 TaxID=3098148 RepID=UPI002B263718|nr:ribose-5-phosphate isomerase RpiA [Halorubellus sp. PRR65]